MRHPGAVPGFQVRGGRGRRAERGAKNFGVFRVKNHDFTPKNHIFSNIRWGARGVRPPPDINNYKKLEGKTLKNLRGGYT